MTEPAWARHLPTGTDPAAVDLIRRGTLPQAWVRWWRSHPDQEVILEPSGTWIRGRDLLDRSGRAAARLAASGLVAGDRILVSGTASVPLIVAHVAALRAGLVVVPVNPAYSRRELDVIIGDARPRAAIVEREELRRWVAAADASITVTDVDLDDLPFLSDSGTSAVQQPDKNEIDAAVGADPALLPYTSGTTGTPKGALLTHANLLASAEALVDRLALDPGRSPDPVPPAVPHARARRGAARLAAGRRVDRAAADVRPRGGARRRRCGSDDVLRRADDVLPPGRRAGRRSAPRPAPVRLGLGAAERRPARPRAPGVRPRRARALRHDRDGDAGLEPARRPSAARGRWASRCPGSSCAWRRDVGDRGARAERVRRLLRAARRRRRGVHRRRLVPHRRHRGHRRRRLPGHRRAGQGADHQRRVQRVPAGGGGRAARPPVGHRRGGGGHALAGMGRDGHRVRRSRGGLRSRRAHRLGGRPARALQEAAARAPRRRPSPQRHGQGRPRRPPPPA